MVAGLEPRNPSALRPWAQEMGLADSAREATAVKVLRMPQLPP